MFSIVGLDPGSEAMWFGEGKPLRPGPYSQESRLPTAVFRTPPTGLHRPSGLQDYKTARTAGLDFDLHSRGAPQGGRRIYRETLTSFLTHLAYK